MIRSPFSSPDFVDAIARAWGGRIVSYKPIPLVEKGSWFLKRAYSLPFGLYGGFVDGEVDYLYLRKLSIKYLRLGIVDFDNRLNPDKLPYMSNWSVKTHILPVPDSVEDYLKSLKKKRRRSLQNMLNRMKRLGISISYSRDWIDHFYRAYSTLPFVRKPLSLSAIEHLRDFSFLVSAVRGDEFIGGMLVLHVGDYGLLWLAGWRRGMQLSEFLYFGAIRRAIDSGMHYLDFGASPSEGIEWFKETMGGIPHTYRVFLSKKI